MLVDERAEHIANARTPKPKKTDHKLTAAIAGVLFDVAFVVVMYYCLFVRGCQ